MKSAIPQIGGKYFQASWIISHFTDHFCYNEVFGALASVLLEKPKSKVEVYNDIDKDVVLFFKILRSRPDELYKAIASLPVSRALYDEWKWQPLPEEPFERTVRWFYLSRNAYGGRQVYKTGWKSAKSRSTAVAYQNACRTVLDMAERFKHVQIEYLSYEEEIEIYDAPTTLHYCDPPYRGREYYYPGNFSDDDHKKLAQILHNCKGKVVLSYYEDELIDELYKDFYKVTKDFPKMSGNQEGGRTGSGREVLFLNFDPDSRPVKLF